MTGGIGRSVVVVSDVQSELFEQAIFILSPKGASGYEDDSEEVLKEARRVLNAYTAKYYAAQKRKRGRKRRALFIAAAAAAAIALTLWRVLF